MIVIMIIGNIFMICFRMLLISRIGRKVVMVVRLVVKIGVSIVVVLLIVVLFGLFFMVWCVVVCLLIIIVLLMIMLSIMISVNSEIMLMFLFMSYMMLRVVIIVIGMLVVIQKVIWVFKNRNKIVIIRVRLVKLFFINRVIWFLMVLVWMLYFRILSVCGKVGVILVRYFFMICVVLSVLVFFVCRILILMVWVFFENFWFLLLLKLWIIVLIFFIWVIFLEVSV